MPTLSRAILILALLAASTLARSDGIYNPTVGTWGLPDGINNSAVPVVASCASPNAPDGAVDLSKCSNAFYVAVIF
jgi:hypothetical protein